MRHQITTFSAEDNAIQWHYCRFLFAMAATIFLGHIGVERAIAEERAWIPVELKNSGGCYYNLIDNSYNEEAKQLALAVLKQADSGKGCLTFPYRGLPYDLDGRLGLSNEVHAGIDLRAGPVDQIYAIEAGKVAFLNFCTAKDKKRCVTKDDFDHSNLMIENSAKTRRVLYLHMSNIDEKLKVGDDIAAGQTIGIAGNVGATSVHVHIEVWPKDSPHYSTRPTGIAKSACAPKTVCADSDIQKYTLDPFVLVKDAVAEKMAECKEAVVTDGISGFEA